MRLGRTIYIVPTIVAAIILMVATGCSTQKNTAATRRWHAFKARYNTYYNGTLAYIDASEEKENSHHDDFTEMLPLYTVGSKQSRETGKAGYDRAIEKSQKTIRQHSIKRRPVWDKKRRKTDRDREWLSRREYNPFLWRAWMLMGRSQFQKGAFDEAASTFAYMSRLYRTQPAIYAKARAWLAKCYIEEGWMYDAEDVIRAMQRDSIHWSARKEWDYTLADYYLHTADYEQAATYLRRVISHEMRRKQRAREWFLMGQLQTRLGNNAAATAAYRHVIRQNPPYEVEFNARIAMTEVMSATQSGKMIARLRRMAASDKNKEYQDQVYYAIGNIYMARRDTLKALAAYERGVARATRTGTEKGVLMQRMGDIYWTLERYADAQRCYGEAIGMIDKERRGYSEMATRSKVLDQLVPYTDALHLQDSLRQLAAMDEAARNAAIDRTIDALKRKEREQRRLQDEQTAQQTLQQNSASAAGANTMKSPAATVPSAQTGSTQWYFYNPMAVSQGKTAFQQQWGKRENVDNWQRVNRTVVGGIADAGTAEADTAAAAHPDANAGQPASADTAALDPHRREYYLAQIPFTDEQKAASDLIIEDALYNAGVIFKDQLDNLALSEKHLVRLTAQYPAFEHMADAYYHLFLLYMRKGEPQKAQEYVSLLKRHYPDNEWTRLVADPLFAENARYGVAREDSLYAATYDAFRAARYDEAKRGAELSASRYPLGANRSKFVFIGALSKLNDGDADGCLADMKLVVEKYPESDVATMAGMIVKGVGEGRRLYGGRFDIDNVWRRRAAVLADSDSVAARQFSAERDVPFVYMIAYRPDSVDENRLLFELARYNFTSYLVRNFDIAVERADDMHCMMVSGFRSYDEAFVYARQLRGHAPLARLAKGGRAIIISQDNMALIGRQLSYADYERFYAQHFAPIRIDDNTLLYTPDIVTDADDGSTGTGGGRQPDEGGDILDEPSATSGGQTDTTNIVPDIEPEAEPSKATTTVVDEPAAAEVKPSVPVTANPVQPTVPSKPVQPAVPAKKEDGRKLEEEFYFGGDIAPASGKGNAKSDDSQSKQNAGQTKRNAGQTKQDVGKAKDGKQDEKKNDSKDDGFDDDEYYDLDGF